MDGETGAALRAKGIDVFGVLRENDAYHALKAVDGLIMTGPTGTNVNVDCPQCAAHGNPVIPAGVQIDRIIADRAAGDQL